MNVSKVIAHRGASGYAPENTFAAMKKAHELGAEWVEFDVRVTQDDELIVFHDDVLNRTTSGKGKIINTPYKKIANLDAGTWFHKQFANERVSTLIEMLCYIKQLPLKVNIEIKPQQGAEAAIASKVLQCLQQCWPTDLSPPIVSSFSLRCLKAVRDIAPNLWLGLNLERWDRHWQKAADSIDAQSVHLCYKSLSASRVAAINQTGRLVLSYTVNDLKLANQLYDWGVTAVFSDYPDKI